MRHLFVLLAVLTALPASAQMLMRMTPPQHRLVHRNTFALRVNPLGLLYEGRFSYRYRLHENESPALRDNFIGIGISPAASPAFVRVGGYLEVQPISIIGFWATYEFMQYFGTFNLAQSFENSKANFSDSAISQRGTLDPSDPQRSYRARGSMLTLGANLNLKFESIVVRSQARLVRPDFGLREGDTTLYDQFYDLLLPNKGFSLVNDLDVLYQFDFGLTAGIRYNLSIPFYKPELEPPADNSSHRIGPFLAYRFRDIDGATFNQPTIALVVNWWVKHRWRTGADTSPAFPYIALAFNVVGDFLTVPGTQFDPRRPPIETPPPASPLTADPPPKQVVD